MKTIINASILVLSVCALMTLSSCTRKGKDEPSKLVIQFPESKVSKVVEAKTSNKVVSGKPSFDTNNAPTSFDTVDCLIIFVGGPEESMRNNYCEKEEDKSNHFKFGEFAGSVAKGNKIELEVSSGESRYIRIYGMKKSATATECPNLMGSGNDSALAGFSPPYLLGETGGISMPPGKEVSVNVTMASTIAAASYINHCQGPKMGDSGSSLPPTNGETPNPGTNNKPYLRIEGLYGYGHFDGSAHFTIKPITIGKCIPVSFKTFFNGSNYLMTSPVTINLPDQSDVEFYFEDSSCANSGALVSSVTIGAGSSGGQAGYTMKVKNPGLTQYDFPLTLSSTEVEYHSDGMFQVGKPIMRSNLPATLAYNSCYPFRIQSFEADGVTPLMYSGSVNLSLSNGSIYSVRTNSSTCNGSSATSSSNFSFQTESDLRYIQTGASGSLSRNLSITGPGPLLSMYTVDISLANDTAGFDILPTGLSLTVPANIDVNRCYKATLKIVSSSNHNVPMPFGYTMIAKFKSNNKLAVSAFSDNSCSGSIETVNFMEGDYSKDIFVKGRMIAGTVNISVSGDYLALRGDSNSFNIVAPAGPHLSFNSLPNFGNARFIGSHEFTGVGSSLPVMITVPAGTVVDCIRESNQSSCNAQMSGATFNWNFGDAQAGSGFRFEANINNTRRQIRFNPFEIYGSLTFKSCNHIHSGAFAEGALSATGGNVNCLTSGSSLNIASTNAEIGGLEIIGTSDQTASFLINGGYRVHSSNAGAGTLLANVKLLSQNTTASGNMLEINNNVNNFEFNNSHIHFSSVASSLTTGIYIQGTVGSVNIRNSSVLATSGGNVGYMIHLYNSDNVNIEDVGVLSNGSSIVGIYGDGGSVRDSHIPWLKSFKYSGDGKAIYLYSASGYYSRITNAVDLEILASSSSNPAIELQGKAQLTLKDSFIETTGTNQFQLRGTGANVALDLQRNIFAQNYDYYALYFSALNVSEFKNNQFVKKGASSTSIIPIYATSAPSLSSSDPNSNLFCAPGSSYAWAVGNKVTGSFSGSYLGSSSQNSQAGPSYANNNHCTYRN
jgi:hypothetical protein